MEQALESAGYRNIIATIGHGGKSGVSLSPEGYSSRSSGMTEAEVLGQYPLVLDLTAIPWDDLCVFSVSGPMVDPQLEPGMHSAFGFDSKPVPFDWTPSAGRDPRLGSAGCLSYVAWDVYAKMAVVFGAKVLKGTIPE